MLLLLGVLETFYAFLLSILLNSATLHDLGHHLFSACQVLTICLAHYYASIENKPLPHDHPSNIQVQLLYTTQIFIFSILNIPNCFDSDYSSEL